MKSFFVNLTGGKFLAWLTAAVTVLVAAPQAQAATTLISTSAAVVLPERALYNLHVNYRPGLGEVCDYNPPLFSWPYQPDFPLALRMPRREYQFQVSITPDFSSTLVNVRTPWNMYNFVPPMPTNTTIYWRVAHIINGATNVWIPTRNFRIAPNATVWDRSMLGSGSYMTNRSHPYILLNANNKAAFYRFLTNCTASFNEGWGANWQKIVALDWGYASGYFAPLAANAAWMTNYVSTNALVYPTERSAFLANLALVWQLTGDPKWIANKPQTQLRWAAQYYLDSRYWDEDVIGVQSAYMIVDMAFAYDLFYEIMTPAERAVCEKAFDLHCAKVMRGMPYVESFYHPENPWNPTNYTGTYAVNHFSPAGIGSSHWYDNHYAAMYSALAGFQVSTNCRQQLDFGLNYFILKYNPFISQVCVNQGRSYGMDFMRGLFQWTHFFQASFPEARFGLSPVLQGNVDWLSSFEPAGWIGGNEPWGDGSFGIKDHWQVRDFGFDFACVSSNGVAMQHWLTESGDGNPGWTQRSLNDYKRLGVPFHFPPPAPKTNTVLARAFVEDGWVIAASKPSNVKECFTNGVGFVFQARPKGSETGHSHWTDLSYQMWAYGAQITDAGGPYTSPISQVPFSQYCLLVDGIGPVRGYMHQKEPWCAKIIAFTNGPGFVYTAAEGVNAYPRTPAAVTGGDLVPEYVGYQGSSPLSKLKSVQRHILFQRNKYFVIFDRLEADSNAKYTWLYQVLEPTLKNLSPSGFSYTCTNKYVGGPTVTVHVAHCAFPGGLNVTNMTGTKVYKNPITGTDYWTGGDPYPRNHALYFSNISPTKNWQFLTVIYPVKAGDPTPLIRRLDDYTVEVTNGAERDVISFDKNTAQPATLIIDVPPSSAGGLSTVQGVRIP